MQTAKAFAFVLASGFSLALVAEMASAEPLGQSFTYQGRLTDAGAPANGQYDFEFRLYPAATGEGQVGTTQTEEDVALTAGTFMVELNLENDIGPDVFNGQQRFLQIGVRPGDSASAYTELEPRQPLLAVPYSLYSLFSSNQHNHFGQFWAGAATGLQIQAASGYGLNARTSGANVAGVCGLTDSTNGYGVVGAAGGSDGTSAGVYGRSEQANGVGVRAETTGSHGKAVVGLAMSSSENDYVVGVEGTGSGTYGVGVAGLGGLRGVDGNAYGENGIGVSGLVTSSTGPTVAIQGQADSVSGTAIRGEATAHIGLTIGVDGLSNSTSGTGVRGAVLATTGQTVGIMGQVSSSAGVAVLAMGGGAGAGAALTVSNGAIRVSGAQDGSNTPVFIHTVTADSRCGPSNEYTEIGNPYADGDQQAILIVTPRINGGVVSPAIAVRYHSSGLTGCASGRWLLRAAAGSFAGGEQYNVMVIKP